MQKGPEQLSEGQQLAEEVHNLFLENWSGARQELLGQSVVSQEFLLARYVESPLQRHEAGVSTQTEKEERGRLTYHMLDFVRTISPDAPHNPNRKHEIDHIHTSFDGWKASRAYLLQVEFVPEQDIDAFRKLTLGDIASYAHEQAQYYLYQADSIQIDNTRQADSERLAKHWAGIDDLVSSATEPENERFKRSLDCRIDGFIRDTTSAEELNGLPRAVVLNHVREHFLAWKAALSHGMDIKLSSISERHAIHELSLEDVARYAGGQFEKAQADHEIPSAVSRSHDMKTYRMQYWNVVSKLFSPIIEAADDELRRKIEKHTDMFFFALDKEMHDIPGAERDGRYMREFFERWRSARSQDLEARFAGKREVTAVRGMRVEDVAAHAHKKFDSYAKAARMLESYSYDQKEAVGKSQYWEAHYQTISIAVE